MRAGKLMGRIFVISLLFVMVGTMLISVSAGGEETSNTNQASTNSIIYSSNLESSSHLNGNDGLQDRDQVPIEIEEDNHLNGIVLDDFKGQEPINASANVATVLAELEFRKLHPAEPSMEFNDMGLAGMEIDYLFPDAELSAKEVNGITYHYIHIQGFGKLGEVGKPALPIHNYAIAVPIGADVRIEILETEAQVLGGYLIHPALEPAQDEAGAPQPEFVIDEEFYESDGNYPENPVQVAAINKLRRIAIAQVQICPVQYNPGRGEITVFSHLKFRIEFVGGEGIFLDTYTHSPHFIQMLKNVVINSDSIPTVQMDIESESDGRSDVIIITHSDYLDAANSLAEWKNKMGYTVEVIAQSSWDTAEVKDAIHSRYNSWSPKPDYFIIIGDHDDVAAEVSTFIRPHVTDLYYACMDGPDDYYPDMAYGRISVSSSSEANNVINKIVDYQCNPPYDADFYNHGISAAYFEDQDPRDTYADRRFAQTSEEIVQHLATNYGYQMDREFYASYPAEVLYWNNGAFSKGEPVPDYLRYPNYAWDGNGANIRNQINSGRCLVTHRDHGGITRWSAPFFSTSDISQLSNEEELPVVFSINCLTGKFDEDCFCEAFLRHSNGGAVGVFGASEISYSGLNDGLAEGFIDAIWPGLVPSFPHNPSPSVTPQDAIYRMGDVLNQGKIRMVETWGPSKYTFEIFHYFGDPTMEIWTGLPQTITATHDEAILLDQTSFSISDASCGTGVATLYYDGEIIGKGTIASGSCTIPLSSSNWTPGIALLTITSHYYRPYQTNIVVGSPPIVQLTNDLDRDDSPAITQTADGKVWVVWSSDRSGSDDIWYDDIWYKTSSNGGATWSTASQLTTAHSSDDEPAITQTADGKVWVVWSSDRSGNAEIWYKTSSDGGATWSATSRITTAAATDCCPAITQTTDGKVWVVWSSWRTGNFDIWYRTSSDGGATWSAASQITTDSDSDDWPAIIQTADGKVWVAWMSYRSGNYDIWYKTSSDGGATWSTASQITTDPGWDYYPAITQTTDGKVWAVWVSDRLNFWHDDILYKTSSDGGTSWSAASRLTRFTGDDSRPATTALSSGELALAWESDRAVNYDIWYGVVGSMEDIDPPPHLDSVEHEPNSPDTGQEVTVRARASDETGVQDVKLVWWIDGAPQANLTMYDDGAHGDYDAGDSFYGVQIGPFPISNTAVEYQIQITDVDDNTVIAPQYPYRFQVEPFVKTADILLVVDGASWVIPYYTGALDALGYSYDVWNIEFPRNIPGEILNQYLEGVIIWATPNYGSISMSETRDNLATYLDNGGRLFISGQDIGYYIELTGNSLFYQDYLHAQYVQDDTNLYALYGVPDDPITDGLYVSISGGDGANNQNWPSEIDPILPAVSIFTYDTLATTSLVELSPPEAETAECKSGDILPGLDPAKTLEEEMSVQAASAERGIGTEATISSGSGALRVDTGTYRVVYFAFGFEAINSAADRATVMGSVVDWLRGVINPPTVTNNGGATDVTSTSARLNGEVTSTGGENPTVTVYWGDNDGGEDPGSWDYSSAPTSPSQPQGAATFYKDVTGLNPDTTYYYRCYAENSAGSDWADSTVLFTTSRSDIVQLTNDLGVDYAPAITQTADDKVWVVWYSYRSGNSDVWYKTSSDGGTTWSAASQITTDSDSDYSPAITQTADGKVWVVWYSYRSGNSEVWYKTSSDGGATWSTASQITTYSDSDYYPAITQTADGRVWVAWTSYRSGNDDIWYKTSSDGGASWSTASQITTDSDDDYSPAITQTADGKVWVVWYSYRSGNSEVWYKTSSDGGATWSTASQITTYSWGDYYPAITQTADDKVWVAWMSYRSGNYDIWYKTSSDGGTTWSDASQFTRFTGYDIYPAATALSSGELALAWESDRAVNYDIWYGVVGSIEDIDPPPHLDWAEHEPDSPDTGQEVTVRARASDETGVQDVQLVWWIDGASQANLTMYDDGAHNDYGAGDNVYGVQIGPFPIADTVVEYQVQITDADDNTIIAPQYPYGFQVVEPFVKTADILLVVDEASWVIPYYTGALDALEYGYDVWDIEAHGNIPGEILNQYLEGVIMWATPGYGDIASSETQDNLATYLDNGGRLFISGQDIGYYTGGSPFYQDYLHAQYVQDDASLYALFGVTDDPITDGLYVSISGGDGANNQYWPSEIDPILPAVSIFTYDPGATTSLVEPSMPEDDDTQHSGEEMVPGLDPAKRLEEEMSVQAASAERGIGTEATVSSGSGALRVDTGTYKVVYFAFGFEAINSAADRATVMEKVLSWLGLAVGEVNIRLEPSTEHVGVGEVFDLIIQAEAGDQPVSGISAFIDFDPTYLEVTDADAGTGGIQITPGSTLPTVMLNEADNSAGIVDYSAGKLGEPFPAGTFTVATIQFRALALTSPITAITFSTNLPRETVADYSGNDVTGTIIGGTVFISEATTDISVVLQGGSRPEVGWEVPITIKFFSPGADVMTDTPLEQFDLTTTKSDSTATCQCTVAPGTYDITAASEHTLINVRRDVVISNPSTAVDMGTLLEGNANDDGIINISDFGILAVSFMKTEGEPGYDARADFDRNGIVNISDFGLLAVNYMKMSPIDIS